MAVTGETIVKPRVSRDRPAVSDEDTKVDVRKIARIAKFQQWRMGRAQQLLGLHNLVIVLAERVRLRV